MNVIITDIPGRELLYCSSLLDKSNSMFIIYFTISDIDTPFFISKQFIQDAIQRNSLWLGYVYEYVLFGRQYYNKIDLLPQPQIKLLIKKRFNFLNPSLVFLPCFPDNNGVSKLNCAVTELCQENKIGLIEYGQIKFPNYFRYLDMKNIDKKFKALQKYGQLLKNKEITSIETFRIKLFYNEILNFRKK